MRTKQASARAMYLVPRKPPNLAQTTYTGRPPTAEECDAGGCLKYCPKPAFDPLWAAVIGAGVGGIVIGTAAYFVGKRKR